MPTTILNPTSDGHVGARTGNWTTLLTATGGKNINFTSTAGTGVLESNTTFSVGAARSANGATHNHRHSFLVFDTSGISSVGSAKLKIYVDEVGESNHEIIVVAGTYTGSPSVNYFNSFVRLDPYTNGSVAMTPGQYNDIEFNIAGIGAISALSTLKLMIIDYEYVYEEVQPIAGTTAITNFRYSEDTDNPPELVIEEIPGPGPIKLTSGLVQITEGLISI